MRRKGFQVQKGSPCSKGQAAGPRHGCAARRQQPVTTTQVALGWKRQYSAKAERMASEGHTAVGARERAGHPHLPAGANSQGSSPATLQLRTAAAHGHGRGGRWKGCLESSVLAVSARLARRLLNSQGCEEPLGSYSMRSV